ncbi:MAG: hypothetical protein A2W17_02155 [Planctomycetes bacterium RBG_16_41_13]|nr:MAG: hypothetical protein A2W17_02155 [Planctomycetes bacterium RBG_16_41_13]
MPPEELLKAGDAYPGEGNDTEKYPIDLTTVLRLAGAQPLELALVREKVHDAYAEVILSKERFIPNITPEIGFFRHEGEIQDTSGTFLETDKQFVSPGVNLNLEYSPGEAVFSALAAQQRYHASKASLETVTQNMKLKAALAYFDLLQSQAELAIAEEALKISETLVRETEVALKYGKGFKGDVLRAKAQLSSERLSFTKVKEALRISSVKLATILMLDQKIELYAADRVITPIYLLSKEITIEEFMQTAIHRRPELREALAILEANKTEKTASFWGPIIPSLQADFGAGGLGQNFDHLKSTEEYNVSLGWTIGSGGLFHKGRREKADARYRSSEIQLAKKQQDIIQEIIVAHTQVNAKQEQITIAKQGITDAEESLRLNEARLKLGMGLPLEVLQAQTAFIQARKDYISSIIDYNKAQYSLFVSVGNKP